MSKFLIRSGFLSQFGRLCREAGIEPKLLLEKNQLSLACLYRDDIWIEQTQYAQLLNDAAQASCDNNFGLKMGSTLKLDNTNLFGALLAKQSELKDIYPIMHYMDTAQSHGTEHIFEVTGSSVIHKFRFKFKDLVDCHQHNLASIGAANSLFKQLLPGKWQPECIYLPEGYDYDIKALQSFFQCKINNAVDFLGIQFPGYLLHSEATQHSVELTSSYKRQAAKGLMAHNDIADLLAQIIENLLPEGKYRKEDVATVLGMHPRVLQKCLQANGLTFAKILKDTRENIAYQLLIQTQLSIDEIATQVGYSKTAAFITAFNSWQDSSPLQWRKRNQGQ